MKLIKFLPWILVLVTWTSVSQFVSFQIGGSYWVYRLIELLFIVLLYQVAKTEGTLQSMPLIIKACILCISCSILYGFSMAQYYEDYQRLAENSLTWFMILTFYLTQNPDNISYVTQSWLKYALLLLVVLLPFMLGEGIGRYLAPFSYIIIFYKFLNKRWRIISIVVLVVVFTIGTLGARTSIMRFSLAIVFAFAFAYKDIFKDWLLKWCSILLLLLPFVLLILALTGVFNVFLAQEEYFAGSYSSTSSFDSNDIENLSSDTRTLLYTEEIKSAVDNDYIIYGRSMSRGYDTNWWHSYNFIGNRYERYKCEVRMLNVFNHMGLIGVVLFSLLYFIAVYNCFKNGNSKYIKILAPYVAVRYIFSWFEDIDNFDLINVYLWITIMMCYSPAFLKMNDVEFEGWARKLLK